MRKTSLITYSVILFALLTSLSITQYANAQILPISIISQSPTDLQANLSAPSTVTLSWTAPSSLTHVLLTGYKIERSTDGGNTWSDIVANTGNTSTTYPDSGLVSGTTYTYRVSAVNPVGTSTPSNTASATTSSIDISAQFWNCCYGLFKMIGAVHNPVPGDGNQVHVQFYAPNGQLVLDDNHLCSSCSYFEDSIGITRDQGKGNYTVVATYDNELVTKTEVPSWINNDPVIRFGNAQEYNDGSVSLNGGITNGLGGEPASLTILDSNGSTTATYTVYTNIQAIFEFSVNATSAAQAFPTSGDYTLVVTHIPTGISASTTFTYAR